MKLTSTNYFFSTESVLDISKIDNVVFDEFFATKLHKLEFIIFTNRSFVKNSGFFLEFVSFPVLAIGFDGTEKVILDKKKISTLISGRERKIMHFSYNK